MSLWTCGPEATNRRRFLRHKHISEAHIEDVKGKLPMTGPFKAATRILECSLIWRRGELVFRERTTHQQPWRCPSGSRQPRTQTRTGPSFQRGHSNHRLGLSRQCQHRTTRRSLQGMESTCGAGNERGLGSPCQIVTVTAGFLSTFLRAFANAS
jgi:hypothetical protein